MFELIYPYDTAPVLPLPTFDNLGESRHAGVEMVPVVEPSGLVVGQASREHVHSGSGLLHPVVHLHIINRNGEIFLQKRSMSKDLFPGRWDTAVGGHVDYGEVLMESLCREAYEELSLRDFNPVFLKSYVWETRVERELVSVFATVGNFRLYPCNDEVSEGRYWTVEEIESAVGIDILTPQFEQEFTAIKSNLLALL